MNDFSSLCFCHRDNFLKLEVFYSELRHEHVEQSVAYDVGALISEYDTFSNGWTNVTGGVLLSI